MILNSETAKSTEYFMEVSICLQNAATCILTGTPPTLKKKHPKLVGGADFYILKPKLYGDEHIY
jgi:hypothetical protein